MTNAQTQLNELKLSYIEYLRDKQDCFNRGMNGSSYPRLRKDICEKLGLLTKTGKCKNEKFLKEYFNQRGNQIQNRIQRFLETLKEPVPQYRNKYRSGFRGTDCESIASRLINSLIIKYCMYNIKNNVF